MISLTHADASRWTAVLHRWKGGTAGLPKTKKETPSKRNEIIDVALMCVLLASLCVNRFILGLKLRERIGSNVVCLAAARFGCLFYPLLS